tara:strand:+ start:73 stop:1164 length:1092 start_codon:yes stop_codon:yes gene_type:complete
MKFFYVISLFSILTFSQNIFSNELPDVSGSERLELMTNDLIREEIRLFSEIFRAGLESAESINTDQDKVNELLFNFFEEKISYEELWTEVDVIKDRSYQESNFFEEKISSLSYSTKSDKDFYKPLYAIYYKTANDLSSYLRTSSRITFNQIVSLEDGDTDKYDEYSAKAGMLISDFQLILANTKELTNAVTADKNSISFNVGILDNNSLRANAYMQKINSLYLINQLDQNNLSELVKKAKNYHTQLINIKTKENIDISVSNLQDILNDIKLKPVEMQIFFDLQESIQLYYESVCAFANANMSIIEIFINATDLSYSDENIVSDSEEFNFANRSIGFYQNEMSLHGRAYEENMLLLQDILLSYR